MTQKMRIASFTLAVIALTVVSASAQLVLEIKDYLTMPVTGLVDGKVGNNVFLSRVNSLKEEPGGARRFFINDQNGPFYILDKDTQKLTTYLDFNGRDERPGLFHRLSFENGYGNGLNHFVFDPDYRRNGKFYTVHMEETALGGSSVPDNKNFPGLNTSGYVPTATIGSPGSPVLEGVVVEWTDTNISNSTFEGTAREIMRVQLTGRAHPMGEPLFNPTARPGDPDWRVLYIGCGDSASGESRTPFRTNPQRLDTLLGKILRIIPDLTEHTASSTVSDNGRYRIPNDNPFVSKAGARKEIWAYGFRNPHRLVWAIDPTSPANNRLLVNSIGLHTWEAVYIVRKGINYGYSQREGNEIVKPDNTTGPLPEVDKIPVYIHDTPTDETLVPTYPVVQYGHVPGGGDAIGNGFLYRGKSVPALQGKYVFTDITTGRMWYADYKEMLAADDGNPKTMAAIHEVKFVWNDPHDTPDAGKQIYDTMFPIAQATYHFRGGKDVDLPGAATVSGSGRADARLSIDDAGELYIYTKTDGMIRGVVAGE
jgi:hypothetical protein